MWKIIGTLASMVVAGVVTFYVTLLSLGKPQSGDEANFNGRLAIAAAILAFLAPAVVVWYLDKRGYTNAWKVSGTLALMVFSGVITYAVWGWIFFSVLGGYTGVRNWYPVVEAEVFILTLILTVVGFVAPGMIVWCLQREAMTSRQSR